MRVEISEHFDPKCRLVRLIVAALRNVFSVETRLEQLRGGDKSLDRY